MNREETEGEYAAPRMYPDGRLEQWQRLRLMLQPDSLRQPKNPSNGASKPAAGESRREETIGEESPWAKDRAEGRKDWDREQGAAAMKQRHWQAAGGRY